MRSSAASESLQRERAVGISKAPSSPAAATRGAEGAVLGERRRPLGGGQRLDRRQQALAPAAVDEQPLLRAVAEHALVVDGAAGDAAAHAELVEQLDHLDRARARHRQVVGAERAAHSRHRMAAAVAAGAVLELEDVAVVDAGAQQRARRAEAGDAGADDDRADAARRARPRAGGPTSSPASRCAAGGRARRRRRPSRRRSAARRRACRRRAAPSAASDAARTSRRVGPAPRPRDRLTAAPCPTRPRRSGRAPGSTAG